MFKKIIALIAIFSVLLVVAACSAEVTETTTSATTTEMTTQTTVETTTVETTTESNEPTLNIVEAAEAAGSFSTLITALETAGLRSTLEGEGAYTVFAPTDAAFSALLIALDITGQDLLALSNLDQILLLHVLNGAYYSTDVLAAAPISIASLQGTNLDFTIADDVIYVNGTSVIVEDILTSNGIIHVINQVLLLE